MADFIKLNGYYVKDTQLRNDIADVQSYIGYPQSDIYGLEVDYVNQTYTRLSGAYGKTGGSDFNTIAPWSSIKRCCLQDNGTVTKYYGDTGYVEDGTQGQVMVEIPKFYYRVVPIDLEPITEEITENNVTTTVTYEGYHIRKARYYISPKPYEGFKLHPFFIGESGQELQKAYISAYEGSIYDVSASAYLLEDEQVMDATATTGDKFCSVAISHVHNFDGTEVTVHGVKPASGVTQNLTRPNIETMCKNRGTGWHSFNSKAQSAVMMLFLVEYGTLNTQSAIGNGVTAFTSGTGNESSYTGSTYSVGNGSGQATSTISGAGTTETANGKTAISYRGIENFWGNIWKFVIDVNINGDGTQRGGIPYICSDFNYAESKKTDNYKSAGFCLANWNVNNHTQYYGYVSAFGYGDPDYDWLFMPSEFGANSASSSKPVGDYGYVTTNLNAYRVALLGGSWHAGATSGGFYWYCSYSVGFRFRTLGGRSVYLG